VLIDVTFVLDELGPHHLLAAVLLL